MTTLRWHRRQAGLYATGRKDARLTGPLHYSVQRRAAGGWRALIQASDGSVLAGHIFGRQAAAKRWAERYEQDVPTSASLERRP